MSFVSTARYVQIAADFHGLEGSASWLLHEDPDGFGTFKLRVVGDIIRGRNLDYGNGLLPRMPAARLGVELTWERERWLAALSPVLVSIRRGGGLFKMTMSQSAIKGMQSNLPFISCK